MYDDLTTYLEARAGEFDLIDEARRGQLHDLAAYIRRHGRAKRPASLVFVCTHNSRRSQFAQLWAAAGAARYNTPLVTHSGGTAITAFNPRAVAALTRAGWQIERVTEDSNPLYRARFRADGRASVCFSKHYTGDGLPRSHYAAVMVCGAADAACPTMLGARARFALPYADPQSADNTPAEAAAYDACCAQIAREMLYVMHAATPTDKTVPEEPHDQR